jgi:hypothetical protein
MSNEFVIICLDIEATLDAAIESMTLMKSKSSQMNEVTQMTVQIADLRAQLAAEQAKRIAHLHGQRVIRAPSAMEAQAVRGQIEKVKTFSTSTGQASALILLVNGMLKTWNDAHK